MALPLVGCAVVVGYVTWLSHRFLTDDVDGGPMGGDADDGDGAGPFVDPGDGPIVDEG